VRIRSELRRFNVLNCGRRWGKTTFGMEYLAADLVAGFPVGWFTPSYKLMLEVWSEVLFRYRWLVLRKSIAERRIELRGGGVVEFWPVEGADVARSRAYKRVVVDEAAMIPKLKEAWERGIRPALSDFGGEALFASTPKGMNYFHQLHARGADPGEPEWAAWSEPTRNNPFIAADEIEAARRQLPARVFAQEYLAEFLPNEGAVFRRVAEAHGAPVEAAPDQHGGHRLVAGLDWGKQHDFTAISVGCATCKVEVARDRYNRLDYAFQRQRVAAMVGQWGVSGLLAERNAMGEPLIEELARQGLPLLPGPDGRLGFNTSAASKPPLIENLALAFERGEWAFQADALWEGELAAYERTVSPITGRSRYGAPEGLHDDTVMARALMVWAAGQDVWLFTGNEGA
jgi:hypothetical protein